LDGIELRLCDEASGSQLDVTKTLADLHLTLHEPVADLSRVPFFKLSLTLTEEEVAIVAGKDEADFLATFSKCPTTHAPTADVFVWHVTSAYRYVDPVVEQLCGRATSIRGALSSEEYVAARAFARQTLLLSLITRFTLNRFTHKLPPPPHPLTPPPQLRQAPQ